MEIQKIRVLIKEKGYNINSLSKKLGMSHVGLSKGLENGTLKVETLEKIAEVLGVSPCYFFVGQNDTSSLKRFVNLLSNGVIVDMVEYLWTLIINNADIIGHAIKEIWEQEPKSKRDKHWDNYIKKRGLVPETGLIHIDVLTRYRIYIDYMKENGLFLKEETEKYYSSEIKKKLTQNSEYFITKSEHNTKLEGAYRYTTQQYSLFIRADENVKFLFKEGLINETDFINHSAMAFHKVFDLIPHSLIGDVTSAIRIIKKDEL